MFGEGGASWSEGGEGAFLGSGACVWVPAGVLRGVSKLVDFLWIGAELGGFERRMYVETVVWIFCELGGG